jgi:predicted nucleic acid-binding protein
MYLLDTNIFLEVLLKREKGREPLIGLNSMIWERQ